MSRPDPKEILALYEPRHPTLSALGFLALWILVLSLPMWAGKLLAGPWSDMYATGFAWRVWIPEQWKAAGHIPLWNPLTFGGMPLVAGMHGDLFYPTAWLRLILPAVTAVNLGFAVHYLLAGLFLYWLLRDVGISWTGSLTGALSYQLSGVVLSLTSPGHDGKLFVTALFPLALLALFRAFRSGRLEYFGLLAVTVGLAALSPHFQMLYYMLVAAGIFALYLAFGEPDRPALRRGAMLLGLALGAVVLGFGIAAIQLVPFFEYIPFSPRAESYYGYQGAITWAIPWSHVPEFFLADFVGSHGHYWGTNAGKLHSEYLGLPVVAL
ncbi:MAG: glycosyltransferase family 39 protein, partial [Gemmatimonadales bacterium]